jgi:hypothetical protein
MKFKKRRVPRLRIPQIRLLGWKACFPSLPSMVSEIIDGLSPDEVAAWACVFEVQ